MKKIIVVLLALFLVTTFSFSAFAENTETYTYEIGNVTVIFDENNPFNATTREMLAYELVNGRNDIAAYGLLCTLFGHDYEESGVTTITHCAQTMQPRCLEEYFVVQVCTRCDDRIVECIASTYITCCP